MICPHCKRNAAGSKTIESRPCGELRRKRLLCRHCAKRFTVLGHLVVAQLKKGDGSYSAAMQAKNARLIGVRQQVLQHRAATGHGVNRLHGAFPGVGRSTIARWVRAGNAC